MQQIQRLAAEFARLEVFQDLELTGIDPDGTATWPASGIARALREAADELAVDGWTSITEASKWIAKQYPEQLPSECGCSSWRQVVHESDAFDLRNFEIGGKRSAWNLERESSANTC